jgi:hypothetical protein
MDIGLCLCARESKYRLPLLLLPVCFLASQRKDDKCKHKANKSEEYQLHAYALISITPAKTPIAHVMHEGVLHRARNAVLRLNDTPLRTLRMCSSSKSSLHKKVLWCSALISHFRKGSFGTAGESPSQTSRSRTPTNS